MLQTTLPLKRIVLAHSLRLNLAFFHTRPLPRFHSGPQQATFSTSPRRYASEDPEKQAILEHQRKVENVLRTDPELFELVLNLKSELEKAGVDISGMSGKMPSKMEALRIAMLPGVRESGMKIMVALQKAGIDSKDILQMFSNGSFTDINGKK
ncbi:hypothetical protein B0H21DRAFT_824776 [Amylocystis lapponica]|nr:hypothetical protein B0H21DRAFT_824776 [Amylocystis lapponica]